MYNFRGMMVKEQVLCLAVSGTKATAFCPVCFFRFFSSFVPQRLYCSTNGGDRERERWRKIQRFSLLLFRSFSISALPALRVTGRLESISQLSRGRRRCHGPGLVAGLRRRTTVETEEPMCTNAHTYAQFR